MRNKFSFLIAIFLGTIIFASSVSASEVCEERFGMLNCSKGEVDSAEANGNAMVIGTIINGDLTVNGQLTANDAKLTSVTVNGAMTLENSRIAKNLIVRGSAFIKNSKIKGTTIMYGHMVAEDTTFGGEVAISATHVSLTKCQTQEIHINKSKAKTETLELDNTIVDGDVIFESKKGSIIMCNDAKILGEIKGGKVLEKPC